VLDAIDAPFVLLSYNDGGILGLDELREELEARGTLRVFARPYVAYRGGKQSATRLERTSELLFVLDTRTRSMARSAGDELRRISALGTLDALARSRFHPERARAALAGFVVEGGCSGAALGLFPAEAPTVGADGRLDLRDFLPSAAPIAELEALAAALSTCVCRSNAEAFDVVASALAAALAAANAQAANAQAANVLARDALDLLAKLCFRKYAADYLPRSSGLRALFKRVDGSARLLARLEALDRRAAARGVAQVITPIP
jgi:hypothetical protein